MRSPFWRAQTEHWYIKINGKSHRLSEEPDPDGADRKHPPKAVEDAWHKLTQHGVPKDMTVKQVFDRFLDARKDSKNNADWCLKQFQTFVGPLCKASKLKPFHLTDFFKKNPQWNGSSQRTIAVRVLAALNFCVREGLLEKNPISSTPGFKVPGSIGRRRGVIQPDLTAKLEAAAHPALRDFLVALRETGCRPSELRRARIERCLLDEGILWVPNKTAKKTGEPERKIYLSPEVERMVRQLIGNRTEGFIWLTMTGKPWKMNNLESHWVKLTEKVPVPSGITLYSYRRSFISSAINQQNVNPALVAQLVGHVGLDVLLKHYLEEDPDALKEAVRKVTRRDEPRLSLPPPPPPDHPDQ